ncbi:hypothetical protein [uncultured Tenacibaculum sp.]|uniref:hypothetical protein n=1 Tax=uncultured Tenacibaculum sp. TaxID=174713 RepID=UPI002605751B|nr:hypothetical protein [uncultured Tenacibaculum sp.]
MKTLKTTLLISMLILLTTSCTDLTKDDLVPEKNNTELTTGIGDDDNIYGGDTGGGNDGGNDDGGKGNGRGAGS